MTDRKIREAEYTKAHTLTPQDFRKLILEKAERAKAYYNAQRKRETAQGQSQIAKCEHTGNEVLALHLKHGANGRTSGWHSLVWEENTSY